MMKKLITMNNDGMKTTVDNLKALCALLEGNSPYKGNDEEDGKWDIQLAGPGSRTRSSTRKKTASHAKDVSKLKESIQNIQNQMVEVEEFVKMLD